MLKDQDNDSNGQIGCDGRDDLGAHLWCTSMLEASGNRAENLELCLLKAIFRVMKPFDISVYKPADENVEQDDKGHA